MATKNHNLSDYDINSVPDATGMKIGIVVAEWNEKYKGTEYHVDLVSVTEITDEEFLEDYIPAL